MSSTWINKNLFCEITLLTLTLLLHSKLYAHAQLIGDSYCIVKGQSKPQLFIKKNQICCKERIQNRLLGQECCNKAEFYQTSKSICCNGSVVDRFISNCPPNRADCSTICSSNDVHCSEQACCGNQTFLTSDSMCCNSHTIHLTEKQKKDIDFIACCNKNLYDIRKELCCDNVVFQKDDKNTLRCCGNETYFPEKNTCLHLKNNYVIEDFYEAVCGDKKYNKRKSGCCQDIVYPVPEINITSIWLHNDNFHCCDHLLMNSNEKCCRKHHYFYFETHTIPNHKDLHCCGNGFYNKTSEMCNNGTIIKLELNKKKCGLSQYDPKDYSCCGDKIVYKINGSKCCEGTSNISVIGLAEICCNGVGIDENSLCCEDFLPARKERPEDDDCCLSLDYSKAKTFNRDSHQRCVNGVVVDGYPKNTEPCGEARFYSVEKEICCGGKVVAKSQSGIEWDCCDENIYRTDTQQCCFDVIYNVPANEGSCCKIDRKFYMAGDRSNLCLCGNTTFDDDTQVCCQGKVYRSKINYECCGHRYINMVFHQCCADRYRYRIHGHIQCCNDNKLYRNTESICRSLVVQPLYTSQLCRAPGMHKYLQYKTSACNSTYGVIGVIKEKEFVKRNSSYANIIRIILNVNQWIYGPGKSVPKLMHLYLHVYHIASSDCAAGLEFLGLKTKVLIFFDANPTDNMITIDAESKVFLFRYFPKRKQEMLSCKLS